MTTIMTDSCNSHKVHPMNFAASLLLMPQYTVSQKTIHLTFDNNFCKFRPVFKIRSLSDS